MFLSVELSGGSMLFMKTSTRGRLRTQYFVRT
jgi:hypothetical protein